MKCDTIPIKAQRRCKTVKLALKLIAHAAYREGKKKQKEEKEKEIRLTIRVSGYHFAVGPPDTYLQQKDYINAMYIRNLHTFARVSRANDRAIILSRIKYIMVPN